jgi:hypothetical protein
MSRESRQVQRRRRAIFKTEASATSIASSRFKTENRRAGSPLAGRFQGVILMPSGPLHTLMRLQSERMSEEKPRIRETFT